MQFLGLGADVRNGDARWRGHFYRVEIMLAVKSVAKRLQFGGQHIRLAVDVGGDVAQSDRAMIHGIHARHDGQQCLRGADVAGGLVALDVLLTGLQGHAQCRAALAVLAHTDDAARDDALEIVLAGKEGRMWPAIAHRHSETLAVAQYHIGTPRTGALQQHKAHDVGSHGYERPHGMHLFGKGGKAFHLTVLGRILQHGTVKLLGDVHLFVVAYHQFDAQRTATGDEQVDGLREAIGRDEELADACLLLGARTGIVEHDHRLRSGSGLIEQRCVGDLQPCQVADHCLEIEQCLQAALGYLGLIGRIGGVPSRILQHIAFHHVGHNAVVVAQSDIRAVELVLGAHLADMGCKFGLGHGLWQVEVLLQADGRGNRLGDQFLDAGHPDGGEHGVNILLAWAYVAVNESVLLHDDGLGMEARIYPVEGEIVRVVGGITNKG